MPANPNLQKIIKLTQEQYDTLSAGGTVGGYTGLNDNYLYLIQDNNEYIPIIEIDSNSTLTLRDLKNTYSNSSVFVNYEDKTCYLVSWRLNDSQPTKTDFIGEWSEGYIKVTKTTTILGDISLVDFLSRNVSGEEEYYFANAEDISQVGWSGSYNDLTDKPTIPTVNNATLTIQKNGSNVATFTANASSNVTANISVPTKTSDLTNDSGFLTDSSSIKESKIIQDTYNTSGSVNQYDRLLVPQNSANRTAFVPANKITVEYSTDGGSTWTNIDDDNKKKTAFAMTGGTQFYIGSATNTISTTMTSSNCGNFLTRVILTYPSDKYCQIDKFYCNKSGPHGTQVKLEYTTYGAQTTWNDWRDWTAISGWTGPNMMTLTNHSAFGENSSGHIYSIRMTFRYTSVQSGYETQAASVGDFRFFGITAWSGGALLDTPYHWDADGNMYSKLGNDKQSLGTASVKWKQIHGITIYENGNSLADKYLGKTAKAADADKLDGNDSTYFQKALPTTTTAGKVLKSTSTAGTVQWEDDSNSDHYPTTFTWTNGTTSGPTGSLTGNSGFSTVSFGAIPSASASQSGVVTTDTQTFTGPKTFKAKAIQGQSLHDSSSTYWQNEDGNNVVQISPYPLFGNIFVTNATSSDAVGTGDIISFGWDGYGSDAKAGLFYWEAGSGLSGIHKYTTPETDGILAVDNTVSKYQSTSVIVGNATTNINGRVFQNYTATLVTAGGYTFYQILKNGNNPTEAEAAEYMRYMTGSTFVPKYNYDYPKQTIFTFADRSTWKPQYSSNDGLRLYRLTTSLALASDIPTKTSDLTNDSGFLTSESDTLATVTGRGATTSTAVTMSGGLDVTGNNLKLNKISAPTSSGGTTYGNGSSGQVLKSNGTTVYWATDTGGNYYHTPSYSSGLKIGTGTGVNDLYVPNATYTQAGVVTTGNQTFAGFKSFEYLQLLDMDDLASQDTITIHNEDNIFELESSKYGDEYYLSFGEGIACFGYTDSNYNDYEYYLPNSSGTIALTSNISNSNILLNGGFSNISNGSLSYSGTNTPTNTVDEWICESSSSSVTWTLNKTTAGVQLISTGSYSMIYQYLKYFEQLWGLTLTMSANIDGIIYKDTVTLPSSAPSSNTTYSTNGYKNNIRLRLQYYSSSALFRFGIDVNASKTVNIKWCKVEIGNIATTFTPETNYLEAQNLSNPNILVNGSFKRNNTGSTFHDGGAGEEIADYWYKTSSCDVYNNNNSISIESTSTWQGIYQDIVNPKKLVGKKLTLSARYRMVSGSGSARLQVELYTGTTRTKFFYSDRSSTSFGVQSVTFDVDAEYDRIAVCLFNSNSNATSCWFYVKLEEGSLATNYYLTNEETLVALKDVNNNFSTNQTISYTYSGGTAGLLIKAQSGAAYPYMRISCGEISNNKYTELGYNNANTNAYIAFKSGSSTEYELAFPKMSGTLATRENATYVEHTFKTTSATTTLIKSSKAPYSIGAVFIQATSSSNWEMWNHSSYASMFSLHMGTAGTELYVYENAGTPGSNKPYKMRVYYFGGI